MISSRVIHDPNINEIAKIHKYKLTRSIVQREVAPRNNMNQVILLENESACRSKNAIDRHVLGYHREDVVYLSEPVTTCWSFLSNQY